MNFYRANTSTSGPPSCFESAVVTVNKLVAKVEQQCGQPVLRWDNRRARELYAVSQQNHTQSSATLP